jgi:hypothetical protein
MVLTRCTPPDCFNSSLGATVSASGHRTAQTAVHACSVPVRSAIRLSGGRPVCQFVNLSFYATGTYVVSTPALVVGLKNLASQT